MASMSAFTDAFFDGFGPAGMFTRLRRSGAPDSVFAEEVVIKNIAEMRKHMRGNMPVIRHGGKEYICIRPTEAPTAGIGGTVTVRGKIVHPPELHSGLKSNV